MDGREGRVEQERGRGREGVSKGRREGGAEREGGMGRRGRAGGRERVKGGMGGRE